MKILRHKIAQAALALLALAGTGICGGAQSGAVSSYGAAGSASSGSVPIPASPGSPAPTPPSTPPGSPPTPTPPPAASPSPTPDTFQVAFTVSSSGHSLVGKCAACHHLSVEIVGGPTLADGQTTTLRRNKTYEIRLKDKPQLTRPGADTPVPQHPDAKFTFWPKEVDGQTLHVSSDNQKMYADKAAVLQYLIANTQEALVQNKDWEDGATRKTATITPIQVTEVSFSGADGYYELCSDVDSNLVSPTRYSAPQWTDVDGDGLTTSSGEHNYPVALVSNTKPLIGAKFEIAKASELGDIKIKAKGPDGLEIPETDVTSNVRGDEVVLPDTAIKDPLLGKKMVKFYDGTDDSKAFKLDWEVKIGDLDWIKIKPTLHTVYVTLNTPSPSYLAHPSLRYRQISLFDAACRGPSGLSDPDKIVSKIYEFFKTKEMRRVDPVTLAPVGDIWTYWGTKQIAPLECWEAIGPIAYGDGRCGGWADLLRQMLLVHGIPSSMKEVDPPEIVRIVSGVKKGFLTANAQKKFDADVKRWSPWPKTTVVNVEPVFFVKFWDLSKANPFLIHDKPGAPGQGHDNQEGHDNPKSDFTNHALVVYQTSAQNSLIYDPSYGTGPFKSMIEWEDASLDGYGAVVNLPMGKKFWLWKKDKKGSQETQ